MRKKKNNAVSTDLVILPGLAYAPRDPALLEVLKQKPTSALKRMEAAFRADQPRLEEERKKMLEAFLAEEETKP